MPTEQLTIAAGRVARRVAYRLLQVWWFVGRPHTKGVKLLVRRDGELLFVRHSYGDRRTWELPGGGMKRGETPEHAARREAGEELGIDLEGWRVVTRFEVHRHATADLTCLAASVGTASLRLHRGELVEARWAAPDCPPTPLGRDARRLLSLPQVAGELARHAE